MGLCWLLGLLKSLWRWFTVDDDEWFADDDPLWDTVTWRKQ